MFEVIRRNITYDLSFALFLVLLSLAAIWKTKGLNEMSYLFPRTVGLVLLCLSMIYLAAVFVKNGDRKLFEHIHKRQLLVISLGMIGYVALIGLLVFLPASIIYLSSFTWYLMMGEEKPGNIKVFYSAWSAMAVSVFFFVLFRYIFNVPLPMGIFG